MTTTDIALITGGSKTVKTNVAFIGNFYYFYVVTAGTLAVYHYDDPATDVIAQYYMGTSVPAAGDLMKGLKKFGKIVPSGGAEIIIVQ